MNRESPRQKRPASQRSKPRFIMIITVATFFIAGAFGVLILKGRSSSISPTPTTTATATVLSVPPAATATQIVTAQAAPPIPTASALAPTSSPPYLQANDPAIADAVQTLLGNYDGVYGVLMMKSDGTVLFSKNSETPFVSASLYKLVLLADLYRKIDAGTLDPTKELTVQDSDFDPDNGEDSFFTPENSGQSFTIERLLFATGAYSSNVAAKMLLTQTTLESLANETVLLGMTGTHLFVKPDQIAGWPPSAAPDSSVSEVATAVAFDISNAAGNTTNLTTPADMARYFQLLLDGGVVNKTVSTAILDILKTQMVDDRFPVLLPDGAEMAHKTGNLDYVVHDVGIIYAPSGPVILIAMVEADSDDNIPTLIEQRLALIAYGTLDVPPIDYPSQTAVDGNSG